MHKVLTFIMAGGKGERLQPLTRDRTKPAVPFGGIYRIIDFSLSNCLNSGLRRIYVLTQYKSASLEKHIRLGWNILSTELGEYIEVLQAQQRIGDVWYRGTADAIYQNIYVVKMEEPQEVLILAGDHIYKMDYRRMLDFHRRINADVTLAVVELEKKEDVSHFGMAGMDNKNRVISFQEKPSMKVNQQAEAFHASMGIYVFKKEVLMQALEGESENGSSRYDFGKDILPKMLNSGSSIYAYKFTDKAGKKAKYWRDIGTIDAYYAANMDLVAESPAFNFYDQDWPIRTYQGQYPPAKTILSEAARKAGAGSIVNSLISGGCLISGKRLEHSVLSYNVRIESGSEVIDSILMEGVTVGRNTRINKAIIDKDVNIPSGMVIGYDPEEDKKHFFVTDSGIVVVAKKTEIK
ncbi:MAG: glucose-1-phosphate adenylyltransferase [Candidatus Omnitrophica bacterium]|nr:glucose-1-phosphate adenylyltransferase [Candidatus Omnitrophota bacterium]MBU1871979.1 glucose-1-phosphate adenylyltransferase [Candidatus Omnitrophota bacterium]